MALTYADIKLRQHRIDWYLDLIRENKREGLFQVGADVKDRVHHKATTTAIHTSVLAEALGRDLIEPQDVPQGLVADVRKKWLKGAADRERDDAALTGTRVHKHAERLAQGEKFDIPEEHQRHIESWFRFVQYYGVEFVDTEFTVFNLTLGYAGTGDFLAYFRKRPQWGLVLGDYKTSKSGLWASVALQLKALADGDFIGRCKACEMNGPCEGNRHPEAAVYADTETLKPVQTLVGVQLTAEGFHVVPVNPSPMAQKRFAQTFKSAIDITAWKSGGDRDALLTDAEPKVMVD